MLESQLETVLKEYRYYA